MNRHIIDIQDFTILVETANTQEVTTDTCYFDEPVIAVAFYGQGNVNLNVKYGKHIQPYNHTKGLALSFYANSMVAFEHIVAAHKPLECIVIATKATHLNQLPHDAGDLFTEMLYQLVHPAAPYVEGPRFLMPPEMQTVVNQLLHTNYEGKAKMMFFKSQITTLLAHFFGQLAKSNQNTIPQAELDRLQQAQEILLNNLDAPPSLTELSKQIGLNTFKLKKSFKELFGVPVFKYLQNERLNKAHELIKHQDMNVQEVAWQVGYDSLSAFSNAFAKKFGFRPSQVKP